MATLQKSARTCMSCGKSGQTQMSQALRAMCNAHARKYRRAVERERG
jgi:hypothetical protein